MIKNDILDILLGKCGEGFTFDDVHIHIKSTCQDAPSAKETVGTCGVIEGSAFGACYAFIDTLLDENCGIGNTQKTRDCVKACFEVLLAMEESLDEHKQEIYQKRIEANKEKKAAKEATPAKKTRKKKADEVA